MKNMMKKALSIIIALAMVIVPMTVFAATGDLNDPYTLGVGLSARFFERVEAGATIYVKADDCDGSTVTFEYVGYTSTGDNALEYTVDYLGHELMPVENEVFEFTMMNNNDTFSITNTSAEALYFSIILRAAEKTNVGTEANPEVLEFTSDRGVLMAYGQAALEDDNNGYFFNVTAPADGDLTVSVGSDAGWMYYAENKTTSFMTDWHYSDDMPAIDQETFAVSAGDLVTIYAQTLDGWNPNPAGTVTVIVTFAGGAVGTMDNPEELTLVADGDQLTATATANIAADSEDGYYYTLTAPNSGKLDIYFESTNGLYYVVNNVTRGVYGDVQTLDVNVQGMSLSVSEGDVVEICVATYDPMAWEFPEGQVTVILNLFVDGGNPGTDPVDPIDPVDPVDNSYTNTYIALEVGDNTCTPVEGYVYTIYQFIPEEEGEYTFTTSDGVIGILPGSVHFFVAPSEDFVNSTSAVFECDSVGQSAIIAIKADSTVNVTVTKEDLNIEVLEWVIYENKAELSKFTLDGDAADLVYVDFEDDVINTAVLGEDGYYHLDSAYGPILYVNLNDEMLPLASIPGNTKLTYVNYDENGNIVEMIDYTSALMEYMSYGASVNGGLYYPLTIDLINMLQNAGESEGWYGEYGWIGASEDAWMFACYYFPGTGTEPVDPVDPTEPTNPVNPEDPTEPTNPVGPEDPTEPTNPVEDPENPNTDNEVSAWAMAAMTMMVATAVAGSAIVIKKTKRVK